MITLSYLYIINLYQLTKTGLHIPEITFVFFFLKSNGGYIVTARISLSWHLETEKNNS